MATEVKLPRLGQGMESGTIVKWLKSEGDKVEKGEPLYELDTDKVTQEVEAEASGVLLKIAISSGEVEVGRTIAVIGEQGEQVVLEPSEPAGNGSAALEVSGDPVAEDVERTAASGAPVTLPTPSLPSEGVEVQQLSSMRKTIARRLTEAWEAPVFQLGITVDMSRALELRERLV